MKLRNFIKYFLILTTITTTFSIKNNNYCFANEKTFVDIENLATKSKSLVSYFEEVVLIYLDYKPFIESVIKDMQTANNLMQKLENKFKNLKIEIQEINESINKFRKTNSEQTNIENFVINIEKNIVDIYDQLRMLEHLKEFSNFNKNFEELILDFEKINDDYYLNFKPILEYLQEFDRINSLENQTKFIKNEFKNYHDECRNILKTILETIVLDESNSLEQKKQSIKTFKSNIESKNFDLRKKIYGFNDSFLIKETKKYKDLYNDLYNKISDCKKKFLKLKDEFNLDESLKKLNIYEDAELLEKLRFEIEQSEQNLYDKFIGTPTTLLNLLGSKSCAQNYYDKDFENNKLQNIRENFYYVENSFKKMSSQNILNDFIEIQSKIESKVNKALQQKLLAYEDILSNDDQKTSSKPKPSNYKHSEFYPNIDCSDYNNYINDNNYNDNIDDNTKRRLFLNFIYV